MNFLDSLFAKKTNIYHTRKEKKSSNPAIAFFQAPAKEQKKIWSEIVKEANNMQREIMDLK